MTPAHWIAWTGWEVEDHPLRGQATVFVRNARPCDLDEILARPERHLYLNPENDPKLVLELTRLAVLQGKTVTVAVRPGHEQAVDRQPRGPGRLLVILVVDVTQAVDGVRLDHPGGVLSAGLGSLRRTIACDYGADRAFIQAAPDKPPSAVSSPRPPQPEFFRRP